MQSAEPEVHVVLSGASFVPTAFAYSWLHSSSGRTVNRSHASEYLHLLLRRDSRKVEQWKAEEVVDRWFKLFPPRDTDRKPLPSEKFQGAGD